MNTKGFASVLIGALFECDLAHEFKRAAGAHERLFTVICVIASFFIFMLCFKIRRRGARIRPIYGAWHAFYRFTLNNRRAKIGIGD